MFQVLQKIAIRPQPNDYGLPEIKDAIPVPISEKNFHPIKSTHAKIGFVDGGNNILFLSPGQSVHMLRLYYSIFENNNKVEFGRYTFILDVSLDNSTQSFHVKIYDVDNASLFPQEMQIPMGEIDEREKIRGVGGYLRRIGEWLLMERIVTKCDVLVHDGSLQTGEMREYEYANRVFDALRDTILVGFSKTCSLITSRGYSLVASIHHLSLQKDIEAPWYYYPVAKNISTIKGDMFVVKLHPHSDYAFRTEVYPEKHAEQAFGPLVSQSNDPTFLGYPYGLLDADINARITEEEAKIYRAMLYNAADMFSKLQANALNAHDRISEVR